LGVPKEKFKILELSNSGFSAIVSSFLVSIKSSNLSFDIFKKYVIIKLNKANSFHNDRKF